MRRVKFNISDYLVGLGMLSAILIYWLMGKP